MIYATPSQANGEPSHYATSSASQPFSPAAPTKHSPHSPAGAHPSGLIGEDPRGRPGNLLPLLAHMAVGRVKDDKLRVFGNDYPTPDGTCVRDYLHVMDLASGHLLALQALAPNSTVFDNCPDDARFKAYNLGKGKGMSVLNIVEAMRKATGFDFKYEVIGRRWVGFHFLFVAAC
jgi:aldose 1-epimerase